MIQIAGPFGYIEYENIMKQRKLQNQIDEVGTQYNINRSVINFSDLLQLFLSQLQMKRNMSKLIAEVTRSTSTSRKEGFKVTCKNANQYVNKILVDSDQFNKLGITEAYIDQEMSMFQKDDTQSNKNVSTLSDHLKKKADKKPYILEHQLAIMQRSFSPLHLQQLMSVLRSAKKQEMLQVRNKLTKLQMSLSFRIQNGDLDPHMQMMIEDFLAELTTIINKTNKIY